MFCSNCGNKLVDGSKFCPGCGTKIGDIGNSPNQTTEISVSAQAYFEQAKNYLVKQDLMNAYNAFKAAVQIAPAFNEAQKQLAQVCIYLQDRKQAGRILNDIISKNPGDYEAFYLRGGVYVLIGNDEKALMDFNTVLKLNPAFVDTYKAIASVYKNKNDWDTVIHITDDAAKIVADEYFVYAFRGEAYYQKNELDAALSDMNKALELKPDDTDSLFLRGMIRFDKKDYVNSLQDFNRSLELSPQNTNSLFMRGKIYLLTGNFDNSMKDFDFLVERNDNLYNQEPDPNIYRYRAVARFKAGWYNKNIASINEDYAMLLNLKTDWNKEDIGFFTDIMVDRYRKAVQNYEQEKKTYLIKCLHPRYNDEYLWGKRSVIDPSTSFKKEHIIIFFDKSIADDFRRLLKYPSYKKGYALKFGVTSNPIEELPLFWYIIHAHTGMVFNRSGEKKWTSTYIDEKDKKDGIYFESAEEALKVYEEIVRMDRFGNKWKFHWEFNSEDHSSEGDIMDIFIAASYSKNGL